MSRLRVALTAAALLSMPLMMVACSDDDSSSDDADTTEADSTDTTAADGTDSTDASDEPVADGSITFATSGDISFLGTPSACTSSGPSELELEGEGNGYTVAYSSESGEVAIGGAGSYEGTSDTVTITERPDGGFAFLVVGANDSDETFDLSGTC